MLTWKATFRTFLNFLNSSFESFTETTGKARCEKRELEVTLYFKISIVVILLREHCHCHINVFTAHSFITFFFDHTVSECRAAAVLFMRNLWLLAINSSAWIVTPFNCALIDAPLIKTNECWVLNVKYRVPRMNYTSMHFCYQDLWPFAETVRGMWWWKLKTPT